MMTMLHMQQLCELIVVSGQELAVFDSFVIFQLLSYLCNYDDVAFTHVPRAHARRATRARQRVLLQPGSYSLKENASFSCHRCLYSTVSVHWNNSQQWVSMPRR